MNDQPEIECRDCEGHGTRLVPGKLDDADTCTACDGNGWRPMTDDELDAAAERQAEEAMSEPPVTMGEMHRAAWAQKQELRRGRRSRSCGVADCPANKSRLGDKDCPKCGASVIEGCREVNRAAYAFVQQVRTLATTERGRG